MICLYCEIGTLIFQHQMPSKKARKDNVIRRKRICSHCKRTVTTREMIAVNIFNDYGKGI
jgi:transcriptional regulator NrdR family protein